MFSLFSLVTRDFSHNQLRSEWVWTSEDQYCKECGTRFWQDWLTTGHGWNLVGSSARGCPRSIQTRNKKMMGPVQFCCKTKIHRSGGGPRQCSAIDFLLLCDWPESTFSSGRNREYSDFYYFYWGILFLCSRLLKGFTYHKITIQKLERTFQYQSCWQ